MDESRTKALCESLDTLVNIDWMQRGNIMGKFYTAARDRDADPLVYSAAHGLAERLPRNGLVMLTGGNIVLPTYLDIGETDGPAGVAILARALLLGLNASPVVLTEGQLVPGVADVMRAAGFAVVPLDGLMKYRDDEFAFAREEMVATVIPFPDEDDAARSAAEHLIDDLSPSAVIAIEKIGMNKQGVYHSSRGTDMSEGMARLDYLFNRARDEGIFTIGIGDGGNEIGYGVIQNTVREHKLYGDQCRCPCGGGIATVTETDVLVTAEVSNWGAYAVAAGLLCMLDKPELVHGRWLETRLLDATARAGFIHLAHEVGPSVDSFSLEVNLCLAELIQELAHKSKYDWFARAMGVTHNESAGAV
jgi:hypothetical protein